ncbi:basic salivary proline-rich protein 2-like, partial [Myotis lucifugus]|uniref:basic salivary proline-rich protein 2-like n=1 Tax=Myotis lucifugus TaxID=59463 RepID=UPI000CCC35A6
MQFFSPFLPCEAHPNSGFQRNQSLTRVDKGFPFSTYAAASGSCTPVQPLDPRPLAPPPPSLDPRPPHLALVEGRRSRGGEPEVAQPGNGVVLFRGPRPKGQGKLGPRRDRGPPEPGRESGIAPPQSPFHLFSADASESRLDARVPEHPADDPSGEANPVPPFRARPETSSEARPIPSGRDRVGPPTPRRPASLLQRARSFSKRSQSCAVTVTQIRAGALGSPPGAGKRSPGQSSRERVWPVGLGARADGRTALDGPRWTAPAGGAEGRSEGITIQETRVLPHVRVRRRRRHEAV